MCALAPGAAIVDETPGTTADVKVALAEAHGAVGPLKLMDTVRREIFFSFLFIELSRAPKSFFVFFFF